MLRRPSGAGLYRRAGIMAKTLTGLKECVAKCEKSGVPDNSTSTVVVRSVAP